MDLSLLKCIVLFRLNTTSFSFQISIVHTSNWLSNAVFPVSSTTAIISLTFALSSGALMELSPHIMVSSRASWMNTYCGYKRERDNIIYFFEGKIFDGSILIIKDGGGIFIIRITPSIKK